jgi:hypothetical protein
MSTTAFSRDQSLYDRREIRCTIIRIQRPPRRGRRDGSKMSRKIETIMTNRPL